MPSRIDRTDFAQIQAVYYDTAEATDAWLHAAALNEAAGSRTAILWAAAQQGVSQPELDQLPHRAGQQRLSAAVTSWLRDHTVGPAPTAQTR